ncbi:MAG: diphosphomevalonate decarboxylase [Acidobacteria bacterium]|uniref:diphosphomevalonate decarboxylase n=1 Tax=Candidatus Sulfomarinibacter kjeldsenii TaxID=2885994 RepID=A0A8J7CER0_9BACT|nr:diphosphomevalonate decarboxylase [Candidatus Sulfomarinibacter kjeldsenii]
MRATAVAHPNIALIKYWGKSDIERNIPAVGSLSITLDGLTTTTAVSFNSDLEEDEFLLGGQAIPEMSGRVSRCLDLVRERVGAQTRARVESNNDFPTAAGLASSASGFAALVTAADAAMGVNIPQNELADMARRSSGSAARSLFGGFVELRLTPDGPLPTETRQILEPFDWPLRVAVAVTDAGPKEIGSTEGMVRTERTSPYYAGWVDTSEDYLAEARSAIARRDFEALAEVSESSCLKMHAVMLSARPGLVYWNGATVECIRKVRKLRADGVPVFFTVDAGPQVKAVCAPEAFDRVAAELAAVEGVSQVLASGLGEGARVVAS